MMSLFTLLQRLQLKSATATTATLTVADWTTSGIVFSRVQRTAGQNQLLQSHFEPWPADFDPFNDASETATLLKNLQQRFPWIGRPVAVSVPRQLTTLRLLQVPSAAAADLAGAVALQIETRQQSAEPQTWDFLQHDAGTTDCLHVTVLQIPARITDAMTRIMLLAGWRNPLLTPADLFVGNAQMQPGDFRISLQMNRSKLEVVVFRSGLPAASMATGTQFVRDTDSLGSIVLSLMQRVVETLPELWRAGSGEIPLSVAGSHAAPLARLLQSHGVTVLPAPFDERSPRAFALVDALYAPDKHCNLLKPRSAPATFHVRHRFAIRTAVAAATLLITAVGLLWSRSSDLQKQLLTQQERLRAHQELLTRGQPALLQFEKLSEWTEQSLHAASEVRNLALIIPPREQMVLTRLQLENISDATERILRVEGLAKDPQVVQDLNTAVLAQHDHYALHPSGIGPAPAGSLLPVQFSIESEILQQNTSDQSTDESTSDSSAEQEN